MASNQGQLITVPGTRPTRSRSRSRSRTRSTQVTQRSNTGGGMPGTTTVGVVGTVGREFGLGFIAGNVSAFAAATGQTNQQIYAQLKPSLHW